MFHKIEHVRGQIGDRATARRRREFPSGRGVGVGAAGVQVGGAELEHATEAAFVDHLLGPQRGGKKAALESHLPRAAVALQCESDLPGFIERGHQGFVAVDVLLMGDRREEGLAVPVVGRADADDVDVGILGHCAEIGGGHVGPDQPPGLFGRFRPRCDDVRNPGRQRRRIVVKRQCRIAVCMYAADHAETENANAAGFMGRRRSRKNERNTDFIAARFACKTPQGSNTQGPTLVLPRLPWYPKKVRPSFADAVSALRRELWREEVSSKCGGERRLHEIVRPLVEALSLTR